MQFALKSLLKFYSVPFKPFCLETSLDRFPSQPYGQLSSSLLPLALSGVLGNGHFLVFLSQNIIYQVKVFSPISPLPNLSAGDKY